MSILTYQDGSFSVKEDEIIFSESQICQSINILLQGQVDVYLCFLDDIKGLSETEILKNSFKLYSIEKGSVLGCEGLFDEGLHYFTFKSNTNSAIYVFCTPTIPKIYEVIENHKEYGAYIITSVANSITNCLDVLSKIQSLNKELETLADNLLNYYWHYKDILSFNTSGVSQDFLSRIDTYKELKDKKILPPIIFDENFFMEKHSSDNSIDDIEIDFNNTLEAIYYSHFQSVPMDARKGFYGHDFHVTSYQCRQGVQYLNELNSKLKESLKNLYNLYILLCSKDSTSIIGQYMKSTSSMVKNSTSADNFVKLIDFIGKRVNYYVSLFKTEFGNDFGIDIENIDNMISQSKLGINPYAEIITAEKIKSDNVFENLPDELIDSARKIVDYSGVDTETGEKLLSYLESFRMLNDKFSVDTETGVLRKNLTELFFKIYEGVIKRVILENPQTRLYHMFLNFGYMDEKLLLPEQTMSLYSAADKFIGIHNNVFSMRDWLTNIYEINKDPSMNEFSMDYNDVFRDMKKRGELTDKDKAAYMSNKEGRLSFEVFNMFKTNQKVCYGQPSTYFPILHKDIFVRDLDKALVTPERVLASLDKILQTDYSAFHREINYKNADKGIEKELLMLQILPDIILMPTFGSRGIMWQEITGRNRSTPGRFIIPIMTAENLDDMIIKLVGNFRWELCRTMMGVAWNDITQKSLTSEYTDYIQFYKKNKELTDDNKEKITVQIVKHRNLMREIFTSDYEAWFNYESKGVLRLNKVARNIFYKYCPFNKQIREELSKHPLFSDIDSRYKILRTKQIREVENHYKKLERSGIELDRDMVENLKFYKEM